MTTNYVVRYDPTAVDALEAAADYISEHTGLDRAAAWLDAMREGVQKLETFPGAFPVVTRRRGRPIRSKLVVSHRIFYFIDEPSRIVYIVDVVHTARETRLAEYRDPST